MSTIHQYYITSQLFQLIEERVASIEVDKKLKPLASLFVKLFDDLDYNFSNELVPEALERLILFVQKDGITSTVEFSQVQAFFTDVNDNLMVRVDDIVYLVVEPSEIVDEFEDDFEEDEVEYEENEQIDLDDEESYIVIDGDEVIEGYELNDEITLDDEDSYLVLEEDDLQPEEDDDVNSLTFASNPIILDNAHAELITLAATTDLDELIEEQIDDLPAFKEVIEQLNCIRAEVKADYKDKKKDKKKKDKKKKSKNKKDKKEGKDKSKKKDIQAKIAKKLHQYIKEKELEKQLVTEFIQLKKQIDYILIQY